MGWGGMGGVILPAKALSVRAPCKCASRGIPTPAPGFALVTALLRASNGEWGAGRMRNSRQALTCSTQHPAPSPPSPRAPGIEPLRAVRSELGRRRRRRVGEGRPLPRLSPIGRQQRDFLSHRTHTPVWLRAPPRSSSARSPRGAAASTHPRPRPPPDLPGTPALSTSPLRPPFTPCVCTSLGSPFPRRLPLNLDKKQLWVGARRTQNVRWSSPGDWALETPAAISLGFLRPVWSVALHRCFPPSTSPD